MSGTSHQQQSSQGVTGPWTQSVPALEGILAGINAGIPSYTPTNLETGAINQLTTNSQGLPNYGPQATNLATNYLGGDPNNLLKPALQTYNQQLGPIANMDIDPTKAPGMQNVLDTIRGDVSNSVNQQFAGAGRDLSGLNMQTVARGISQGEAQPLLDAYYKNIGAKGNAAGNLFNAAGGTDAALTGNSQAGLGFANAIPALTNASPMGVLSAQGMQRSLPLSNLGMLENLTVPIASLGGTSNTQTQGSYTMSPWQQAMQAAGLFSGQGGGAVGGAANAMRGLLSMFG